MGKSRSSRPGDAQDFFSDASIPMLDKLGEQMSGVEGSGHAGRDAEKAGSPTGGVELSTCTGACEWGFLTGAQGACIE